MNREIEVKSKIRDYCVNVTDDCVWELERYLNNNKFSSIFVLTDRNLTHKQSNFINYLTKKNNVSIYEICPGGEEKNLDNAKAIYELLVEKNFTKRDLLISFGGGVVGDLGGFIAATFNRGMNFIQIPTTLLSQVDSSIGGKVAVHLGILTNMIGAIYPPIMTLICPRFLETLPSREFSCGMSEIIKIAFLHDESLWNDIKTFSAVENREILEGIIVKSVLAKKKIVENDEFEIGDRLSLNFGHTFSHALESVTNHETFLHGEAVAIGMVFEIQLSLRLGLMNEKEAEEFLKILGRYQLPTNVTLSDELCSRLISVLKTDKKNRHHKVRFILPEKGGYMFRDFDFDDPFIIGEIKKFVR